MGRPSILWIKFLIFSFISQGKTVTVNPWHCLHTGASEAHISKTQLVHWTIWIKCSQSLNMFSVECLFTMKCWQRRKELLETSVRASLAFRLKKKKEERGSYLIIQVRKNTNTHINMTLFALRDLCPHF